MRRQFCALTEEGLATFRRYEEDIESARKKCASVLGEVLERDFGVHALHPGMFPSQWKMPGGCREHGYPPTDKVGMMTGKEVSQTRVLKRPKLEQEHDLFNYAAQYTNICRCHKCNGNYCLRKVIFPEPYDKKNTGKRILLNFGKRRMALRYSILSC